MQKYRNTEKRGLKDQTVKLELSKPEKDMKEKD